MENPSARAGVSARNLVSENGLRVKQDLAEINAKTVNVFDLTRDFPIIATHWFGHNSEAVQ